MTLTEQRKGEIRTIVQTAIAAMDAKYQKVSMADLILLDSDQKSVEVRGQLERQMFHSGTFRTTWIASIHYELTTAGLDSDPTPEEDQVVDNILEELGYNTLWYNSQEKSWWITDDQSESAESPAILFTKAG